MRLTNFTDFGLRTLMKLAGQPERTMTVDEIASEFNLSRNHLAKVVQELSRNGFIVTQRGAGGGFRLAQKPEDISIGEIARTLEAPQALVECFRQDGGACVLTPWCNLKRHLARAQDAFFSELDDLSLADCAYRPVSSPGMNEAKDT